jgi:hypothetical protein
MRRQLLRLSPHTDAQFGHQPDPREQELQGE